MKYLFRKNRKIHLDQVNGFVAMSNAHALRNENRKTKKKNRSGSKWCAVELCAFIFINKVKRLTKF